MASRWGCRFAGRSGIGVEFASSTKMTTEKLEALRQRTRQLCEERRLKILPYGRAWWILGHGVSFVVAELAGLGPSDLRPLPVFER